MEPEYEKCRSALEKLTTWYETEVTDRNRNEATTRVQLIDRLLFECLRWDRSDCKAEESNGKEFTDYSLFCPIRILIVEAKKEGIYFELPAGYKNLEYSIHSLCRDNAQIKGAIEQAMGYCQRRGTPLGVVCNGHQLICFLSSRDDGKPPLDGGAVVFGSLQIMLDNFLSLWKYLSKPGVQGKNLQKHLLGADNTILPEKLSSSIFGYPGTKGRNVIQTDLQIVGELVIEDVAKVREIETDFIKECFCHSGALSQYALISKSILEQRYAALFDAGSQGPTVVPATTKKGITKEVFAESLSRRPIILLGDVGVGKTMFIRYLIKVEGAEIMKRAIGLYVDLGTKATLTPNLRAFFLSDIERQLLEDYAIDIRERNFVRGVYNVELQRFAGSIYTDLKTMDPQAYIREEIKFLDEKIQNREEHLRSCFIHISKGRRQQIILFLDNADQRDEAVQQDAFFIAQEIAANWPVTVFLSIRPQTFHRSKKTGALSGYHPKAFSIAPPRVDEVLKKRLSFALKVTKGEIELKTLSADVHVKLQQLDDYLNVLLYSFAVNRELIEFIDNVCSGNIRLALEFVTTFIGSGHVDTQKILDIEIKQKPSAHYLIPLHEFLRAIIYGDNEFYDPQTSPVVNLFDISTPSAPEHFLMLILIEYVNRAASFAGVDGFVEIVKVYEYLQEIGYTPTQIEAAIDRCLVKNLLEAETRTIPDEDGKKPQSLRATTVGVYHCEKLSKTFAYIDAITVDTPILADEQRKKITNVDFISDRLSRAEIFCSYLDAAWAPVHSSTVGFKWDIVSQEIRNNISNIRTKLDNWK